jgi:hypothetical protein
VEFFQNRRGQDDVADEGCLKNEEFHRTKVGTVVEKK